MASSSHPFVVKVYLSAEEIVSLNSHCEDDGISQSTFFRMYLKTRTLKRAMESAETGLEKCHEVD